MSDFAAEHAALTRGAALVEIPRTLIQLTGVDRAGFLHNFCTNDIRRLTPGAGCEMFITNVQGKTLGHGYVYCEEDSLVLDAVAHQAETLIPHLDRYLVREDVQLHDHSTSWSVLLLAGEEAEAVLRRVSVEKLPQERLGHKAVQIAGMPAALRRVEWTGPHSFELQCVTAEVSRLHEVLVEAGAVSCGAAALDAARIEAGTPLFGRDISSANLPQEVNRDALAISFTKGCYLGQETVARIDALGHVNKILCGVRFPAGEVPAVGAELVHDGRAVGVVTSATFSPRLQAPLALAYLRRGLHAPGTQLPWGDGVAEVVALPIASA